MVVNILYIFIYSFNNRSKKYSSFLPIDLIGPINFAHLNDLIR